ncbi:MAG TPA: hypothetical protein VN345_11860 [Blastocatellia bacterium]|jgi:hypothetical protein|nr:hypothetical protein [Blastocatellia bacterium]
MAADDKKDVPKPTRTVFSDNTASGSFGAEVRGDSHGNVEWKTVFGGLPDLTPEEAINFYNRALASLQTTRVRGFYGATDGSSERPDDVTLLLYRDDPKTPVVKLVLTRSDILRFADALNDLVARFRQ